MQISNQADVVVVGSGNAGFSAALTAHENGANVLMLEKATAAEIGGNTWFSAGAYRLTHSGLSDLADLVGAPDELIDVPAYSSAEYLADMERVTEGRCRPELTRILIDEARDAAVWMRRHGIRWRLMPERQAHLSGGHLTFWGGLALGAVGGGAGMIDAYQVASLRAGVELRTGSTVEGLILHDGAIAGVHVRTEERKHDIRARAVVLASGGFEANDELRMQHLGPEWLTARVRGTSHNTGKATSAAIDAGAQVDGDWAGCHAIAWDADAPPHGDRSVSNRYSRQGYPFGVVVNLRGERFVDEGADFRNYTYAKYGAEILRQPSGVAFQLFDAKTIGLTSAVDYATATGSRYEAATLGELADRTGIDRAGLEKTIRGYNGAISDAHFDPTRLDGKRTDGVRPPKSNWAQPLDRPPFIAFGVVCGITFTFGGLRIDEAAAVLREDGRRLSGLFAAGEAVGGLFYHNYPGGTGLASGAVFGRRAGRSAAEHARKVRGTAAGVA